MYSVFRHDRSSSTGGGVLVAVSNAIKSSLVHSQSFGTCECIFIDIVMNDHITLRVDCIYRPPSASFDDSVSLFNCMNVHLENVNHFVIYGDFNLSDIDWANLTACSLISKEFLDVCSKSGATQCVSFPTRKDNMLDLILCSDQNMIQEISCTEPFSCSDHNSISFKMQEFKKQCKERILKPCFKKADYGLINSYLATVDWESVYSECVNADDYYVAFKNVIDYVVANFVPFTSATSKKCAPWFNDKLKHIKRVKQRKWQRYMRNKNIVKYAQYQDSAVMFKSELLKAKCNYEKNLFENRKTNSKKFYNYIRKQTTVCSAIPCLKNGEFLATSDKEKADLFSEYFATVFVDDNQVSPDFVTNCENSLSSFSCDKKEMIKIGKKLKLSSSPGPDRLSALFMKNIIANIADPLCKLYNICLSHGHVPADWKIAHVIPIYKKGNSQLPSNYRPVSLTSILCKILERIVRPQMISYLFDNNIIPKNQHGFLSKKSTVSNLIECLDKWTKNYDKGCQSDVIYLDYSKCFDSVVHSKLLQKLSKYGITGNAYRWIENFLVNRIQHVKVGQSLSDSQSVISGVPQGTVLGPLLFLCFSSDINTVVKHSCISMYADDTKLFRANNSSDDCCLLQADLDRVYTWASDWQLKLNPDKTKHLRIGHCKHDTEFYLNGVRIDRVDSVTDIGIQIQSNLKFTSHCCKLVKKVHFNIRNIFNTFRGHNVEFYVNMYKTYVRPILESSSPVWSPYLKCNIDKIESVQRHFTRKLPGFSDLSYEDRLCRLNLESLHSRRIKADLLLYYKMSNGLIYIDCEDSTRLFHSHRGHSKHLFHFYSRTEARKNFWANRIVRYWNNLSENIVNSTSVKEFKRKLNVIEF
jgi:hypothetical protein